MTLEGFGFFLFIFNLLNFIYTPEKKSSHQVRGKGFCVWVFLALWVFPFACFYSAVEFKPCLRGFRAKYKVFCLSWQVGFLPAGAPYVLFVLGRTGLCAMRKSKDVPPAHS